MMFKFKNGMIFILLVCTIATNLHTKTVLCVCKNEDRKNVKNAAFNENAITVCNKECANSGGVKQAKSAN